MRYRFIRSALQGLAQDGNGFGDLLGLHQIVGLVEQAVILSRLRVDLLDAVLRNVYKFGDIDSAIGSRGVTLAIPAFLALPNMRE